MENFMIGLYLNETLIGYFHNETEINGYIKSSDLKKKKKYLKTIRVYPHV